MHPAGQRGMTESLTHLVHRLIHLTGLDDVEGERRLAAVEGGQSGHADTDEVDSTVGDQWRGLIEQLSPDP